MRSSVKPCVPLLAFLLSAVALAADPPKPAPKADDPLPWLTSLADGQARAQKRKQPVLVRVVAESCPWCAKLEKELNQPKVQEELARWALVVLDVDRLDRENRTLLVGAVPALRLLSPTGRVMASRDGFVEADALLKWLKENYEKTAVMPAEDLTGDTAPTPAAVARLVGELKNRDPGVREAAVRRLLPYPVLAAPAVADAFARGPLQTRLSALELLRDWKAPVLDLDPWQPETLKPERLDALRKWAAERKPLPDDSRGALTPDQRDSARRDLARLVQAPDTEAVAIRERLARHGPALLPEVYALLKDPGTDQARERLTALRYRLAASTALALALPGGLDRLASGNAAQRHQAVQELLARVTAAEEPLLLELFSNPDPLVRELSLRGLRKVAGSRANTALTRLLDDPEPNVRAAVLKQLAEKPAPALVPQVREYLAKEKDPDLIVHAVRVFRGSSNKDAVVCLTGLLTHESWRVRAEAAEALGETLVRNEDFGAALKVEVYASLIERLQDKDGFVVSRAVKALRKVTTPVVIEPLVQAAETHPELAPEIITGLCYNNDLRAKVLPYLRKFCAHKDPAARATALKELRSATQDVETELRAGLKDPQSEVRIAAATALLRVLQAQRGRDDEEIGLDPDEPPGKGRTGKGLPTWLPAMIEVVQPLLEAEAPEERLAAALVLAALGKEEAALPVLLAVAKAEPKLRGQSAAALMWLPWPKRLELYKQLLALRPSPDDLATLAEEIFHGRDKRAIPLLWDLAARDDLNAEGAGTLVRLLRELYFGDLYRSMTNNRRNLKDADRKEALAAARPRTASGPELQRLIALALVVSASAPDAVALAAPMVADEKASAKVREDAFKILLLGRPRPEAVRSAVEGLRHPLAGVRWQALIYLTGDVTYTFESIADNQINLDVEDQSLFYSQSAVNEQNPWMPAVPKGLTAEALRPLLADAEPRIAAQVAYLLALVGDDAGLAPLLRYWRERAPDDETWARLVYRAIAALGDDRQVNILEDIYGLYETEVFSNVSDFYWTIRCMDGANALKLRKRMRQEMGMDRLR